MRWPAWTLFALLLIVVCRPEQFLAGAAGQAPSPVSEAAAHAEEKRSSGSAPSMEPQEADQAMQAEPPQEAPSPVWRQGSNAQSAPPGRSQSTGTPAQPVWRRGAQESAPPLPTQETVTDTPPVSRQDAGAPAQPVWRHAAGEQPSTQPAKNQKAGAPLTQDSGTGDGQSVRLFQTAAFRGNFNALPKWQRVLSKAKSEVQLLNSCTAAQCPPGGTSWQRILSQAKGQEPMAQLKMVNSFFNKWPYRLDNDAYGTSDWWATPLEFLKLSGDCEDYAITKYFALRELGFAASDLRVVVLKDRIRGIGHAILVVILPDDAYVLDNITDAVFSHGKYTHYVPQYSLNEEYRWSHIPMAK